MLSLLSLHNHTHTHTHTQWPSYVLWKLTAWCEGWTWKATAMSQQLVRKRTTEWQRDTDRAWRERERERCACIHAAACVCLLVHLVMGSSCHGNRVHRAETRAVWLMGEWNTDTDVSSNIKGQFTVKICMTFIKRFALSRSLETTSLCSSARQNRLICLWCTSSDFCRLWPT